jgi:nucleoside-diphosphate-sugar epimerase
VARKIAKGQIPFQALGTGEEKRDFVYIDDVVRAIVLGIEKDVKGVFNVGAGQPISIKDLVRKMFEVASLAPRVAFAGSARLGDFSCNWADAAKIINQIGWRPETALEEGLKKTIEWYKNNG